MNYMCRLSASDREPDFFRSEKVAQDVNRDRVTFASHIVHRVSNAKEYEFTPPIWMFDDISILIGFCNDQPMATAASILAIKTFRRCCVTVDWKQLWEEAVYEPRMITIYLVLIWGARSNKDVNRL